MSLPAPVANLRQRFDRIVHDTHTPFVLTRTADDEGYSDDWTHRAFILFAAGYWIGRTDGADEAIAAVKRLTP